MEFVFELLSELFFECFGQGFITLCSCFVPDGEGKKRKAEILCLIVSLTLLAGLFVGIIVLSETGGKKTLGLGARCTLCPLPRQRRGLCDGSPLQETLIYSFAVQSNGPGFRGDWHLRGTSK